MAVRIDVTFPSGSDFCAASFYRPTTLRRTGVTFPAPWPGVIMAPSFGDTRSSLARHAERFADAGLAVLLFDYRHFGASGGEPRQLFSVSRQTQDYRAAIRYLRSRSEIDGVRLALWGTGVSAGHAIVVGASESRLAAVVAQAPFLRPQQLDLTRRPWPNFKANLRVLGRDLWRSLRGESTAGLPIVGLPDGPACFIDPEVQAYYALRQQEDPTWENRIRLSSLRSLRSWVRYRPAEAARRLTVPLLVCAAAHDRFLAPEPAVEAARQARRGEFLQYPAGHFALAEGPMFERVIADQIDFLRVRLGLAPARSARPLPGIPRLRRRLPAIPADAAGARASRPQTTVDVPEPVGA